MASVARLRIYPVKALDGTDVEEARITEGGSLAGDREFAMFGPEGEPVNGKRTTRVHDLKASFTPEQKTLSVVVGAGPGVDHRTFDLETDREAAEEWLSDFFEIDVILHQDTETGFPDRPDFGPSVISTATLEEVASWFDEVTVNGLRKRLRANVEIGGVEPFWEDRFLGPEAPAFEVGGVRFEGVKPCGRCVVPERDPATGERDPDFRERFVERRRETFPGWADEDAFEHFYAVMLIADVPEGDRGGVVQVGDEVRISE